jgi:hypothetical protein
MPLPLRTVLSLSLRGLDTLGFLTREDLSPDREIPPTHALHACLKGLRQIIKHLMRHPRNTRSLKYGKVLKKPNVALKFILRTAMGSSTQHTPPTDLSIIKDATMGLLITTPSRVVNNVAEL